METDYDNNDQLVPFYTVDTDTLVASVDFDADTVATLAGQNSKLHTLQNGYSSGDLTWAANVWNGGANDGEFTPSGTGFHPWYAGGGVTYEVYVRDSGKVDGASHGPSTGAHGGGGH